MPNDSAATETEKGFGTGLRAQLERRKAALQEAKASNEAATAVAEAAAKPNGNGEVDAGAIQKELADALEREKALRAVIDERIAEADGALDAEAEISKQTKALAGREQELAEKA